MVYSVINGISKTQGAKDGGNRKQKTWRNLILSTGETNPESLIGDRAQWKAGNRARLPDIQAEAKHGIYDTLHAGFKVQVGGNDEFYILPLVFREEIAQSFPIHTVCKVLSEKGRLKPSKNGYQHQIKVNKRPIRHYVVIEKLEL